MDVAFVSLFREGRRQFEYVDTKSAYCPLQPGQSNALWVSACSWVVDGRLPSLIPVAADVPEMKLLAPPGNLPVGAQVCVPLRRADGEAFGSVCCFSHEPDPTLRERDLDLVRMFASVIEAHLSALTLGTDLTTRALLEQVLDDCGPRMALQPIVHLPTGELWGLEALARFPEHDGWDSARWFAEAEAQGLASQVELCAVRASLRTLPLLTDGVRLTLNVSAQSLLHPELVGLLTAEHAPRLVVEVTERHRVADFDDLADHLAELRAAGVWLALDDAGSGWAGLADIERLQPEVLKLDHELVHDIAACPARQAMVEAMLGLARRMEAVVVAEGLEREADRVALVDLGVEYAQGFLLGRPTFDIG
jgi:EAL domain-containing protein (putative c-di-GMP-specific phosphodiesterase class I)